MSLARQKQALLSQSVADEVKELAKQGYKEITLLGQNVNSYLRSGKKDFESEINFKNLKNKNIVLEKDLETLYSCLDLFPKNVEQLMSEMGKNSVEILRDLIRLEMMGLIVEPSKNY